MRRWRCAIMASGMVGTCGAVLAARGWQPQKPGDAAAPQPPEARTAAPLPAGTEDRLKEIARQYTGWKRVSDQAWIAPQDCEARPPSGVLLSESSDGATHGKKLYFLYVKEIGPKFTHDYATSFEGKPAKQPVGQAIVKQSWEAVGVDPKDVPRNRTVRLDGQRPIPEEYLVLGDAAYRTGTQKELYVMLKLDPATPGTDQGWVYATLEADGSKVIQAGAIASCMKCHEKTENDRLFGQPRARHDREAARQRQKAQEDEKPPTVEPPAVKPSTPKPDGK